MSSSRVSHPYETPLRANSFFTHLSYDIRCLIYDLLELPPISHKCLGFVLSCQQALSETERAAVRNLNLYLTNVVAGCEQPAYQPLVPHFPPDAKFGHLTEITMVITSDWLNDKPNLYLKDLLRCYFSKVTFRYQAAQHFPCWQGDEINRGLLEPLSVRTSYHKAETILYIVMFLIERTQPFVKNTRTSPTSLDSMSVHTKTIGIAWGGDSQDRLSEFEEVIDDKHERRMEIVRQQQELDPDSHSWPTLTQLCRKDGLAYIVTVSSESRWNDPFNKSLLFNAWAVSTERRDWLRQRQEIWSN
jgi:hypothetical protein